MTPADALRWAIEEAADLEARTRAAAQACRRHPSATVRQSTADAHAEAVARLVALRAPAAPTADDLACAAAVLAETADRAQRLASLYRTETHQLWAERAARAHAAIVQLQEAGPALTCPDGPPATLPETHTPSLFDHQEVGTAP